MFWRMAGIARPYRENVIASNKLVIPIGECAQETSDSCWCFTVITNTKRWCVEIEAWCIFKSYFLKRQEKSISFQFCQKNSPISSAFRTNALQPKLSVTVKTFVFGKANVQFTTHITKIWHVACKNARNPPEKQDTGTKRNLNSIWTRDPSTILILA